MITDEEARYLLTRPRIPTDDTSKQRLVKARSRAYSKAMQALRRKYEDDFALLFKEALKIEFASYAEKDGSDLSDYEYSPRTRPRKSID